MQRFALLMSITLPFVLHGCLPRNDHSPANPVAASMAVTELRCEYSANPLAIDTPQPRFTWLLESPQRAQRQTAYQILVASNQAKIQSNIGDRWDTGKVASNRSANVVYQGTPLTSGDICYWKVRVWDKDKHASSYSKTASFEIGLLHQSDWQGKWISATKGMSAPLLRKQFNMDKRIKRAKVHISGLGYYELYINGQKIGDQVLDPGTTYYNNDLPLELGSRVLYATHDVTDHLKIGQNAVAVMLGNGWYSAEDDIPPSPSHREPYGDRPILIMQMNIESTDGKVTNIVSDKTWKTAAGPITYNDYSNGEIYDARLEMPGWNKPGFNDSDWSYAQSAKAPGGKLVSQTMPPIKVVKTFKPVRILNPKENVYVYDFGQNFSGWTKLRVKGPKGTRVTIKHGARVHEDGSLDARSNLYNCPDSQEDYLKGKGAKEGWHHVARQSDTYILKGKALEVWEPRFTLHGFRYAEVTGFPGIPTLESLEGRHVRSAVETVGDFTCSNDLINRIHQAACWTFMSSMQSFPQDAADRSERVGWLGDPIPEDFMLNYHTAAYWAKYANDLKDAQKPNGDLPVYCPLHWRRTYKNGYHLWPVWKSTYPIVVWSVYQFYEDKRILEEHYQGLKKLVDLLTAAADNHIISQGHGDHMEAQPDGTSTSHPTRTPKAITSTAYYYFDTWILAQAANILGKTEDARHYANLAETIKNAFNQKFLNQSTNQYATGSQTSNAIALQMDLVPADRVNAVVKNLVEDIESKHKNHLSTGMLGANALAQALPEHGAADVMYKIATQTTFPGWGYMIAQGATTLWEAWEGNTDPQLSYNMKLHGSIDKFFYKGLAGIRLDAPGYKKFTIKPCVVEDLTFVKAKIKSIHGLITVDWKKGDKCFDMTVTVPTNTTAMVSVPKIGLKNVIVAESGRNVYKAGTLVKGVAGIITAVENDDYVTLDVGSGAYAFRLTDQQ